MADDFIRNDSTRMDKDKLIEMFFSFISQNTSALESQTSAINRMTRDVGKNLTGDLRKDIQQLTRDVDALAKQNKSLTNEWKSYSGGKKFGTQYLQQSSYEKITKEYLDKLNKVSKTLEISTRQVKEGKSKLYGDILQEITEELQNSLIKLSKNKERDIKSLESKKSGTSDIKELIEISKQIEDIKKQYLQKETDLQKQLKDADIIAVQESIKKLNEYAEKERENAEKEYNEKQKSVNESLKKLEDSISVMDDSIYKAEKFSDNLRSSSNAYSKALEKRARKEESPAEQMRKLISDAQKFFGSALEDIDKVIEQIEEKLENDIELDENQKENLKIQLENAKKQRELISFEKEYWKEATPGNQLLKDAGKSLLYAGKTIVANIGKNALKYVEDKYLTAYREGFNNVYNSVEQTRNSVSARLRLDQGGFTELQDSIQERIESEGYQGTITQSDVNEALVSLSASGITDTQTLEALAFEQAKLSALQSSTNLQNEETLQRTMELLQKEISSGATKEGALVSISNLFDDVIATETALREEIGDAGLVNNQANQILNQQMSLALETNRSMEQLSEDISSAYRYSNMAYYKGMDPNVFSSILKDLRESPIDSYNMLSKILITGGFTGETLTSDELNKMTTDQIYEAITDTMLQIANLDVDDNYLASVMQSYGLSNYVDVGSIRRLRSSGASVSDFATPDDWKTTKRQNKIQTDLALQENKYLSATRSYQNEAENKMAEIAIKADEIYKGNDVVSAGFEAVETGISALEEVGWNIVTATATGGFGQSLSGTKPGAFLTGNTSGENATYGKVGKGLGIAAGVGVAGYSLFSEFEKGESLEDTVSNVIKDGTFYQGVGTAVGSALGGPITGAILGGILKGASTIGTKIEEKYFEPLTDKITDVYDTTQKSVETIMSAYNDEYEKASEQYDKATEQLEHFNKMTTYQKQLYMVQKGIISDSQALAYSDKEIQDEFQKNVIDAATNLKEEADLLLRQSALLANEESVKNLETGKEAIRSENFEKFLQENENNPEAIKNMMTAYLGNTYSDLYGLSNKYSDMEESQLERILRSYGMSNEQIDYLKIASGGDVVGTMAKVAGKEEAKRTLLSSGYTESEASTVVNTFDVYSQDIENYNTANEGFQENWKELKEKNPTATDETLYQKYMGVYGVKPDVARGEYQEILLDSNTGLPYLDKGKNNRYKSSYSFATGITNVPFDNYPALLHRGERVLTSNEAEAYNEMSSYAVSNMAETLNNYGNSSNIFNTTSYGLGDVETSINNQTRSLSSILTEILTAIRSIQIGSSFEYGNYNSAKRSAIAGNTNLTQLNTM